MTRRPLARRAAPALGIAALVAAAGCSPAPALGADAAVGQLRPVVLAEVPHDTDAFTEGLEIDGGALYESTGLPGRSQLRELDPATGAVRRAAALPGPLFGEGITVVGPRIWQLTWQDGVAIEWDAATFTPLRRVPIDGEGWGLCRDGDRLVRSDGTDRLRFHDPATFAETGSVAVTMDGDPLTEINELECVDGQVWANVWKTDRIVRIDPASGRVTAVVDASALHDRVGRAATDVLNGIAAAGPGEFLLTGKYWPTTFRVRFDPS
jgi:glutaminyl-peptide cyclotransferase